MNHEIWQSIARGLAETTREYVRSVAGVLEQRLVALEEWRTQAPVAGPAGPQGEKGLDGAPGRDGSHGINGKDGEPGRDGKDGEPGQDGATGPAGPAGEKGSDGRDGLPGQAGRDGLPGAPGEKGLDGKDGRDGVDGLGFDDLDVEHDGERSFTFKFVRGERVKTFGPFIVPAMIHRGVWRAAQSYSYQDVATFGGSEWLCVNAELKGKPGAGSPEQTGWLLIVKKGADGRQGPAGPEGPQGKSGPQGPQGKSGY